ncbi:hypothetical protein U1Q18_027241, partial [Sarracenia purpurea var. burkii]
EFSLLSVGVFPSCLGTGLIQKEHQSFFELSMEEDTEKLLRKLVLTEDEEKVFKVKP